MDLLTAVVVALLSGGTLAAFFTYKIAKRKAPAEVDSIVVQGAESAVLSLQKANEVERHRAERAERDRDALRAEVARKDARIEALERQLDRAQEMLNQVREELEHIRRGDA